MSVSLPKQFQVGGLHCGLKRNPNKQDVAIVFSERPAAAAGVYTTNLVFAAPVAIDRERTPSNSIRGVVINSGNANACTGERGLDDARRMTAIAAEACGCGPEEMLVLSTGIIGEFLPMEKIDAGVRRVAESLGRDEEHMVAAARGMMTTDTFHKLISRRLDLPSGPVTLTGFCKGAAMIGPNMATMLGLVVTDANVPAEAAQAMLREITEETFNCISVEGHMSTNDTVLLLANGAASSEPLAGKELAAFQQELLSLCTELAKLIPLDGEGTDHVIEIEVGGCRDRAAARQIAKTIAESALVKTAVAGADPNWGRIVSAAGYAGVPFDPSGVDLHVNGHLLYQQGAPVAFDEATVSRSIKDNHDTSIVLRLSEGEASIKFWTTDLTTEYVRLNADYHT